jgi:hypothetical protein
MMHNGERASLEALMVLLRANGVTYFAHDGMTIQFGPELKPAPVAAPTTPEQPGNKTTPTKGDIFDVLQSGVIPGAPVVEPTIGTG